MDREVLGIHLRRAWLVWRVARSVVLFMVDERRRGTLIENLSSIRKARRLLLAKDMSHAELLEEKALELGNRPFLFFKESVFTFREMDLNANRLANFLRSLGGGPGKGVAIVMKNSPRWLDVFFGLEKLGMYAVPTNVALRGDQLAYILDNSEASFLVIDWDLLEHYAAVREKVGGVSRVLVNLEGAPDGFALPGWAEDIGAAYRQGADPSKPDVSYDPDDLCVIMYTSGTTGLPKGVVYRYGSTNVKAISLIARIMLNRWDVTYTCYPLFHANALFLTITPSLHCGCRAVVAERFSASTFWDQMRRYGVTTFNGLGAVMPILMKQPERPDDADNRVHTILSAGCPADIWRGFEERFGLRIMEGYGAVDGGGAVITNFGTAPVGSMGKPFGTKCRVVDAEGDDAPPGTPGELITFVGERKGSVEYFKNTEATNEKLRDGWLYTGDLVYLDEKGYVYFVGRSTESMRCRGENVSAYEVEHALLQHPDVLECAAYAVPSELAEDEIMVTLVQVEGKALDPTALPGFLVDRLAKFAIPRYYRVVECLPKTETHRVIKKEMEKLGITEDTYDCRSGEKSR